MLKKMSCFLLSAFCLISVTACSSSDNREVSSSGASYMAYETTAAGYAETNEFASDIVNQKRSYDGGTESYSFKTAAPTYGQNSGGDYSDISDEKNTSVEKKIIRNANLSLETANVEEAYQKLLDFVKSFGGYEFSMDMNKSSEYISLSATIKVNPDSLDDVLDYAAECGEVKYMNTSSDDITASYYDIELRLENKRKNLDKYYEYLKEARNVDELIMLQNEIDRLTSEIESYEGQLKLWNTQTSESEIYLNIYQKGDPVQLKEVDWSAMSLSEMITSMGNGFKSACNVILGFFQWLIIVIITFLPVAAVLGVVAVPVTIFVKKKRKNKDDKFD